MSSEQVDTKRNARFLIPLEKNKWIKTEKWNEHSLLAGNSKVERKTICNVVREIWEVEIGQDKTL